MRKRRMSPFRARCGCWPSRGCSRARQPRTRARSSIEDGPERIETGWWDGRDVRRDYYVARTPAGVRLWVFRERRAAEGRWFLHGVFG